MRTIIASLFASLLVVSCSSSKSTELDQSIPYSLSTYSSLLPQLLFRNSPRDTYIRMLCFPSFEQEWGLAVAKPEGEMATAEYVIAERSIWLDPHPRDIKTTRTTAQIAKSTAQTLHEAWTTVLRHPERMKVRNFNIGGVACRFESFTKESGPISGEAWTPRNEYPTGILVELGEMVRDLTRAEVSNRPNIENRISQKVQDSLDRLKEMDRPTNATEPVLVVIVPDHVGWTVQKSPVLYFYISQATSLPIRFSLLDKRRIAPVADVPLSSPTGPGLVSIRLKDYNIVLEPDVVYRWYVAITTVPSDMSKDVVAGGAILFYAEDVEFLDTQRCDKKAVRAYAKAGIWYDAMACLYELIEANPEDRSLLRLRDDLLRSAGLGSPPSWLHLLNAN